MTRGLFYVAVFLVGIAIYLTINRVNLAQHQKDEKQKSNQVVVDTTTPDPVRESYVPDASSRPMNNPQKPVPAKPNALTAFKQKIRAMPNSELVVKRINLDEGRYLQITVDDIWYSMARFEQERLAKSFYLLWWESKGGGSGAVVEIYDGFNKFLARADDLGVKVH